MLIVYGKLKQWSVTNGIGIELMVYDALFANLRIGRGLKEYERGEEILGQDTTLDSEEYERAIQELAEWCEV